MFPNENILLIIYNRISTKNSTKIFFRHLFVKFVWNLKYFFSNKKEEIINRNMSPNENILLIITIEFLLKILPKIFVHYLFLKFVLNLNYFFSNSEEESLNENMSPNENFLSYQIQYRILKILK